MSLAQKTRRYTAAEYYRLEAKADYKSDFYDGEFSPWPAEVNRTA
jgi:hypothetical protein